MFDTSRTFNGKVFRLRDHLERLFRSLKYTRIDPGMTIAEMEQITLDVVQRNESVREPAGDDYMITQIVTRGFGSVASPSAPKRATATAFTMGLAPAPSAAVAMWRGFHAR